MAEEPQSLLDSPATAEMLFPTAVAAGLAVAPLALGLPTPERRADTCLDVQIFLARGSSEPYPGLQISVVDVICAGLDSCGYQDIVYPAVILPVYCASVAQGVSNGTAQIKAYAAACPDSRIVPSGYSQVGFLISFMSCLLTVVVC